jgi:3-hydroxybutyryl-CoA dehydratase
LHGEENVNWNVGDSDSLTVEVTEELTSLFQDAVVQFSVLPDRSDQALEQTFGGRVVHGVLPMTFLSSLLGNQIPGPGGILLGQLFRFVAPMFVGDTVTATATIREIRRDKPVITLDTAVVNQTGVEVVRGEAQVLYRCMDNLA